MPVTQPLKGFRDFLPSEAKKRAWLKTKIATICESWGYDPMETPTLEPLELFAGQVGDDEKLFFQFEDHGGRQVALRYDQTIPSCRVVGANSHLLSFPFRRYQIQNAYRAENPQRGRYREFLQVDADIFGLQSPFADAEVIALSLDIHRQLGFKQAKVLVNDRKLLKDIPYAAIVAIDKLDKIGPEGVVSEMQTKGISSEQAQSYLRTVRNLKPNQTVDIILDFLKNSGFPSDWYAFEPTLSRSFSYSTGPIWEVKIPSFTAGSVLGGERFDHLIEKISGKTIPGTGFGLGFDRTLEAADQFGLIPRFSTSSRLLVTVFSPQCQADSLNLTLKLRQSGINVELYPDPTVELEKQLKYASRKDIPFVAILGPEEISSNLVNIKDLSTGEQRKLKTEEIKALIDN